ncbi:hypothetical protein Vafri_10460 [Volvox africanus]|uniref:Uncharacterized protein n=1 Tax=Volvox africanus TaxID=51714 RepID=A0A8J4F2A6_9CHLO|nr:hypothetical protein Vafri_10460 [Volvox africanus]
MDIDVSLNMEAIKAALSSDDGEILPSSSLKEREPLLANLRRSSGVDIGVQTRFTFDKATQTPSRRTRDGQPILPIAEHSPSMTNSAAELPRDVVGDDAMEASDGEPPAKRSRSGAPQAAAAAVGAGPSSVSRPRKHSKRGGFGGRGYARGGRQGHQQGRGGNGSGGGANQPPMSPDQERELTRFYNRYGRQMTRGELRDLRKEAGGNVCYCCRSSAHSYDECTLRPAEARAAMAQGNGH